MFEDKRHEINQLKEQIEALKKDKETLEAWGKKKQEEFLTSDKERHEGFIELGKQRLILEALKQETEDKILEVNKTNQEAIKNTQEWKKQHSDTQALLAEVVERTVLADNKEKELTSLNLEVTRKLNTIREIFQEIDKLKKGVLNVQDSK
jgi:hypothetical protein